MEGENVSKARLIFGLDMALSRTARVVRAASWYCSLERPYASARLESPLSSKAANLSVDDSSESRNSERADISAMNASAAGEETEKMSRKLGTPRVGCPNSE
jgi:hypothetical protein